MTGFAAYVRGHHHAAFGHAWTAEGFVFEDHRGDVINLLVAAEFRIMQSMLLHISSFCDTQSCPDKRILAQVSVTSTADSPTLLCLPHGLPESFLAADINNEGIDFDLRNDFMLEVSLLDEFCLVLHCLHDFCNPGQAVHSR